MEPAHFKILELSELAGGLAHEIRNPLSTLKVNLQLLHEDLRELPEDACVVPDFRRRALKRLDTLQNETGRLQHLLDRFLRLVSTHDIEAVEADLREVVAEVASFCQPDAEHRGVILRHTASAEPLLCRLDRDLLKQAILNLILNGQQAMPDGGELVLVTRRDGRSARLEVSDTAGGIDPEVLPRIFTPFFSTKKDGSGLGLSLTRRIVHEHGGLITVESELGRGTRFVIMIPVVDDSERHPKP